MLKLNFWKQTSAVYSLYPEKSKLEIIRNKTMGFLMKHRKVFIIACLIILGVLIGLLALAIVKTTGNTNISMVESGQYYNHLKGVI